MGNTLGWGCLILTLKGHLCGAMEHLLTFTTGRNTSQTTFEMKTVFTLLGSFKATSMSGTMSIAQTATDSHARKVRIGLLKINGLTPKNVGHQVFVSSTFWAFSVPFLRS